MASVAITKPPERHYLTRIGWLRAAVLGANDGVLSVASILVGVAAGGADAQHLALAGTAALVAGALSMAAGEYVSVSSQADTERADLAREEAEIAADPRAETRELAMIYVRRGLDRQLAMQVAQQLMARDALAAHARDELGITEISSARPVQAALASAASFAAGGVLPLTAAVLAPMAGVLLAVVATALVVLAVLGALGARTGGAPLGPAAARVLFWGVAAFAVTFAVGRLFGV